MDICQKVKHQLHKTKPNCRVNAQVLHSFRTSESCLRGVMLPMGPTGVIVVDIVPCILFVIQDMQEGDMLCGRHGPHTTQIQRQSCNADYEGLACHKRQCKYLYADPMHLIAQSDDLAIRQRWSQHGLDNAFQHMAMADPDRGIFGATPVETLHAFRKGLVEMVTHIVIDNVPPSKKGSIGPPCLAFSQSPPAKLSQFIPIHNLLQWDNQHFQDFCC